MIYSVVGVTFENRQEKLNKFYKNYRYGSKYDVTIVPEENNKFDKNALAVNLEIDGKMEQIGYISKKDNVDLKNKLNNIKDINVNSIGPTNQGDLGINIKVIFDEE